MPIYEYQCCQCGRVVERFFRMVPGSSEEFEDTCICEDVGLVKYKKIISTPNFRIKGFSEANGYSRNVQDGSKVVSVS